MRTQLGVQAPPETTLSREHMDENEDPFRYCVYCRADCYEPEPEHSAACPSSTGVFPVRERDVLCPGCKKTHIGMRCGDCEAEFQVGDHYTHRKIGEAPSLMGDGDAPVYEIVCLGCAAQEALT